MMIRFAALAAGVFCASAASGAVFVDELNGSFAAGFNYNFGTSSDFTGNSDFNQFLGNGLLLAADRVTVTFSAPVLSTPSDFVASASVEGEDFIDGAPGTVEFFGVDGQGVQSSVFFDVTDSVYNVSSAGSSLVRIDSIVITGFEHLVDRIEVDVVPAPSSSALLALGGASLARRRRG